MSATPVPLPWAHRPAWWGAERGLRGSRWVWRAARALERDLRDPWVKLPDGTLLPNRYRDYVVRHLYQGGYEFGERVIVRSLIRPGSTVVDVGANVGAYTQLALRAGASRVIALEPGPAHDLLVALVQLLGSSSVEVLRLAAGADRGDQLLHVPADQPGLATVRPMAGASSPAAAVVATRRLDDLDVPEGDIDFVKIDVEGAEAAVLEGASGWLEAGRVRALLVEASPEFGSVKFVDTTARDFDLDAYVVAYRRSAVRFRPVLRSLAAAAPLVKQANVLFVRRDAVPRLTRFVEE